MNQSSNPSGYPDDPAIAALYDKLADALTPGYQVECDPEEAEQAGAFVEDAMSETDAIDSALDMIDDTMTRTMAGTIAGNDGEGRP